MDNYDNLRQIKTTPVLERPTLRFGDQGDFVKELQSQLKYLMFYTGEINGIYDEETRTSVRAFEANNKLPVNGIVDADNWSALIYLYSPLAVCNLGTYVVKSGDSLWSISEKFNTTVAELMSLNNLTSSLLKIGQILTVPGIEPPTSNEEIYHTVISGDTLWSISRKYDTTVDLLKKRNNLVSNTLSIGQVLIIPGVKPPTTNEEIIYTVLPGDTLWGISIKYNTTVDSLKKRNNLVSNTLSIGQKLIIPNSNVNNFTYTVLPGDTLWSISIKYNTTVDAIKQLNNLTSNLLNIYQELQIPVN
jgi:LysM repeat protein